MSPSRTARSGICPEPNQLLFRYEAHTEASTFSAERGRRLAEDVEPDVVLRPVEGAIGGVDLHGEERLQPVASRGQEREVALGAPAPPAGLDEVLGHGVEGDEVDGAGRREVAELDEVRPLVDVHLLERLRDQEVQVRIALAVGVRAEVHGQPVDEERDVGAVVGVEPAQEVLLGFPAARVLADDEPRHEAQDVGGAPLRPQLEVAARDEELGGG